MPMAGADLLQELRAIGRGAGGRGRDSDQAGGAKITSIGGHLGQRRDGGHDAVIGEPAGPLDARAQPDRVGCRCEDIDPTVAIRPADGHLDRIGPDVEGRDDGGGWHKLSC